MNNKKRKYDKNTLLRLLEESDDDEENSNGNLSGLEGENLEKNDQNDTDRLDENENLDEIQEKIDKDPPTDTERLDLNVGENLEKTDPPRETVEPPIDSSSDQITEEIIPLNIYLGTLGDAKNVEKPREHGLWVYPSGSFHERMERLDQLRKVKQVC